jgi:hypothetical protein
LHGNLSIDLKELDVVIARLVFKSQGSVLVFGDIPMPSEILLFIAGCELGLHASTNSVVCASLEGNDALCKVIEAQTDV